MEDDQSPAWHSSVPVMSHAPLKTERALADQWKVSTFLWYPRDSFVTKVMSSMYIAHTEEHLNVQTKGRWVKYVPKFRPTFAHTRSVRSSAQRSGPKLVKFRPSTQYRDKNNFDFYYGRREGAGDGRDLGPRAEIFRLRWLDTVTSLICPLTT